MNKRNNLNILRFICAISVIISHSYALTGNNEPLLIFNGLTLGEIGVSIFFFFSGILITKSYFNSLSAFDYIVARFLRIFPALLICIILSIFIIGALSTKYELFDYYTNFDTYKYFISLTTFSFLLPVLPGVFTDNPENVVNGSLWTLKFEILCYLLVVFLGLTGFLRSKYIFMLIIISLMIVLLSQNSFVCNVFKIISYFYAGVLYYFYSDRVKFNLMLFFCSFFCFILLLIFGLYSIGFLIFGTYVVYCVAFFNSKFSNFLNGNDVSYGLYIYAFPVQQLIVETTDNNINVLSNFFIAFFITFAISYASWKLIEKPSLMLRKKLYCKHQILLNTN